MSSSVNKVILVGHLGKDPEMRYTAAGAPIASFNLATSEQWKDKQSGEKTDKTEWHDIVMFDKVAEIAGQYLRKGSLVYLEGKLQTEKWTDKEGHDRYTTKIIANQMTMLGGKGEETSNYSPPAETSAPVSKPRQSYAPPAQKRRYAPPPKADFDDDAPFN